MDFVLHFTCGEESSSMECSVGTRNVQKQSRSSSSCFEVIVAEHSAESLTPLDSGERFANGAERPQQPVLL